MHCLQYANIAISALMEPEIVAAEVARKTGVDTSLPYRWRQQLASARAVINPFDVAQAT